MDVRIWSTWLVVIHTAANDDGWTMSWIVTRPTKQQLILLTLALFVVAISYRRNLLAYNDRLRTRILPLMARSLFEFSVVDLKIVEDLFLAKYSILRRRGNKACFPSILMTVNCPLLLITLNA
jgi:hypothetical protein